MRKKTYKFNYFLEYRGTGERQLIPNFALSLITNKYEGITGLSLEQTKTNMNHKNLNETILKVNVDFNLVVTKLPPSGLLT